MNRHALVATTLFVASLALGSIARADDPAYVTPDELAKKRGTVPAMLVVVGKDDSDEAKTVLKLLADPKLAKAVKDGLPACRIDPNDEAASKLLGIPVEKNACVIAFDGYALPFKQHAKAINADTLSGLVKAAADETKKKKATEKSLDKAEAKGEDLAKKGDTAGACQQLLAVFDMKAKIPCDAVDKAEKKIEELKGFGMKILTEARAATAKKDFSKASKLIADAQNSYPIPAVLDEAKAANAELGQAEKTALGK